MCRLSLGRAQHEDRPMPLTRADFRHDDTTPLEHRPDLCQVVVGSLVVRFDHTLLDAELDDKTLQTHAMT